MADSKPTLSSKTPDSTDYNTLILNHDGILALPRERRYAIVELKTRTVNTDVESGEQKATMQIVHLEQPQTAADQKALVDMLDQLFTKRTKQAARPDPEGEKPEPLPGLGTADGLDDSVTADEK